MNQFQQKIEATTENKSHHFYGRQWQRARQAAMLNVVENHSSSTRQNFL